jgi:hypothetical protein
MEGPHLDRLIKIAGFLDMKYLIPDIRPFAQPGNTRQIRWAALLSLSRMGDLIAMEELLKRVRKVRLNDDVVYTVFPDLIYTRQRAAINFLVETLHSETKNCTSADVEREVRVVCGFRIMEQLAPVIEGYPLKLDASGDINADDYPLALKTVRRWFDEHPTYTIIDAKY